MVLKKKCVTICTLIFFILTAAIALAEEVTVYSARSELLTRIPFNQFFRATGIRVNVVNGDADELLDRLKTEGENSPADVFLTVDAGSLWEATQAGYFQKVDSEVLSKNVPVHLRDPDNHWFGLSKRARTAVYSTKRVETSDLSTYEDLAGSKWKGRLCLRTAKKVYNQSLVAMMIKRHGIEDTEKIVKGWVENLAQEPYAKDNEVIMAINEGKCDVGLVNQYYFGRMLKRDPEMPASLFWLNQGENDGGVYVDISGAGILKNAKHKESAVKFLEWLSSETAQNLFADSNMEYPVNPGVEPAPEVQAWGDFKQNTDNISHSGVNQKAAIELMQKVGYK